MLATRPILFLVIPLLLTSAVRADTIKLTELQEAEHPTLAKTEAACDKHPPGQLRTISKKIGGTEIEVLHECGVVPANAQLAIHKTAWFLSPPAGIRDFTNTSEKPSRMKLVSEALTAGSLADKTVASVFRLDLEDTEVERTGKGKEKVVSRERHSRIQICSLGDKPRCEDIKIMCPKAGCAAVSLNKGVLSAVDKDRGKIDFTVE
ncbi:MAG: hypothetical protein JWO36_3425 [Myxococcales bacterium]|nr:hypothetical protein [Myxococcales bacterium]